MITRSRSRNQFTPHKSDNPTPVSPTSPITFPTIHPTTTPTETLSSPPASLVSDVSSPSSLPLPPPVLLRSPSQFTKSEWERMVHDKHAGKLHIENEQYIEDITVEFLYKPHTITALGVILATMIYYLMTIDADAQSTLINIRIGVWVAVIFVLVLGLLVFPSGPFIRPHPLLWRFTFGVGVVYEVFLCILLFQKKSDARYAFTFFDQTLNQPLKERQYADHCELEWTNIKGAVWDIFMIGHFVGWVLKSLLLRDFYLCWIISISWELIEIAFTHMLPNFAECWWDQWILDVLLCNGLGIYVGNKLCDFLEMKQYQWRGFHQLHTTSQRLHRLLGQFTPSSWIKVRWESTKYIKRFIYIQLLVVFFQLEELNAFFLKHILWVPPPNALNHVRLGIWFFTATPALRQFYSYVTDPTCKRIGNHTLLVLSMLATEVLVIIKFGKGEFSNPMPPNVQLGCWIAVALVIIMNIVMMFRIRHAQGVLASPIPTTKKTL